MQFADPLHPSALASQICNTNLRSLRAAMRATERERVCDVYDLHYVITLSISESAPASDESNE